MDEMKAGSKRYRALLEEALELHMDKNQGYSASNPDAFANFRLAEGMGLTPVQGVLVRLGDKFARVQSLAKNPANDRVGESMRDTLMDLSAYALIAICLMEEDKADDELGNNLTDDSEDVAWQPEWDSCCDSECYGCSQTAVDNAALHPGHVRECNAGCSGCGTRTQEKSIQGLTCYNRDQDGKCLGHPVKDGPFYHDSKNPPKNLEEETENADATPISS